MRAARTHQECPRRPVQPCMAALLPSRASTKGLLAALCLLSFHSPPAFSLPSPSRLCSDFTLVLPTAPSGSSYPRGSNQPLINASGGTITKELFHLPDVNINPLIGPGAIKHPSLKGKNRPSVLPLYQHLLIAGLISNQHQDSGGQSHAMSPADGTLVLHQHQSRWLSPWEPPTPWGGGDTMTGWSWRSSPKLGAEKLIPCL